MIRDVFDRRPEQVLYVPSEQEPKAIPGEHVVLVVDDDEAVLSVASKVLARGGYQVVSASGGHQALEIAEERQGGLSLLLSDLVMPGMGGRELGEIFEVRYPDVPILYMSAYTEDETILQGVHFSEINFIPKPFTVEGLCERAREVIEQSKAKGPRN